MSRFKVVRKRASEQQAVASNKQAKSKSAASARTTEQQAQSAPFVARTNATKVDTGYLTALCFFLPFTS